MPLSVCSSGASIWLRVFIFIGMLFPDFVPWIDPRVPLNSEIILENQNILQNMLTYRKNMSNFPNWNGGLGLLCSRSWLSKLYEIDRQGCR
jgi:hypothetical protein